ncbi:MULTISPECIES: hypothetical protein [unclassified Paraflavitalea]|uniref:hypothetical protein n=1 Tax=unclassified Paraflavitalea TaxID=2798305 RepID=UPI003D33264A
MRLIKELMEIMVDHVCEIGAQMDKPFGLCGLCRLLLRKNIITGSECVAIQYVINEYTYSLRKKRSDGFAFPPCLIEPRRELLNKIISEL